MSRCVALSPPLPPLASASAARASCVEVGSSIDAILPGCAAHTRRGASLVRGGVYARGKGGVEWVVVIVCGCRGKGLTCVDMLNYWFSFAGIVCDIRCVVCDIRCVVCDIRWVVCDIRWVVCDIRCVVCDIRCVVCDMRCVVCDIRSVVCDIPSCLSSIPLWILDFLWLSFLVLHVSPLIVLHCLCVIDKNRVCKKSHCRLTMRVMKDSCVYPQVSYNHIVRIEMISMDDSSLNPYCYAMTCMTDNDGDQRFLFEFFIVIQWRCVSCKEVDEWFRCVSLCVSCVTWKDVNEWFNFKFKGVSLCVSCVTYKDADEWFECVSLCASCVTYKDVVQGFEFKFRCVSCKLHRCWSMIRLCQSWLKKKSSCSILNMCIHVYIYIYTYKHMYTCVYKYTYIYIYIYTPRIQAMLC